MNREKTQKNLKGTYEVDEIQEAPCRKLGKMRKVLEKNFEDGGKDPYGKFKFLPIASFLLYSSSQDKFFLMSFPTILLTSSQVALQFLNDSSIVPFQTLPPLPPLPPLPSWKDIVSFQKVPSEQDPSHSPSIYPGLVLRVALGLSQFQGKFQF